MKLFNYQFNRREKVLLALLAVVVLVVFSYQIVYRQQLPAYHQLRARLQSGQERLAAARQAAAAAPALAREAKEAQAAWEAARQHLGFTLRGTSTFLAAAQPRVEDVHVLAFRPLPVEERQSFRVFPFEVAASGPYPAVQDYIDQLETLPALMSIRNLKILALEDNGAAVEAGFIIDLYDLGDDNRIPAAVALFPTGRIDAFRPPAGLAAAAGGSAAGGASPGEGEEAREGEAGAGAASTSGSYDQSPPAPSSPPVNPAQATDLPLAAGDWPQYTFPHLAKGRLVPGPAFKEPAAGEGDVWLEELRVLRNVGPFFVLDRPAALAGISLARSTGVYMSQGEPQAELRVELGKKYARMQGYAGVDDRFANSSGKVNVTIFADGRPLYQGEIWPGDYPCYLDLPLSNVQQLTFKLEWQAGGTGDYDQLLATLASIHFARRE